LLQQVSQHLLLRSFDISWSASHNNFSMGHAAAGLEDLVIAHLCDFFKSVSALELAESALIAKVARGAAFHTEVLCLVVALADIVWAEGWPPFNTPIGQGLAIHFCVEALGLIGSLAWAKLVFIDGSTHVLLCSKGTRKLAIVDGLGPWSFWVSLWPLNIWRCAVRARLADDAVSSSICVCSGKLPLFLECAHAGWPQILDRARPLLSTCAGKAPFVVVALFVCLAVSSILRTVLVKIIFEDFLLVFFFLKLIASDDTGLLRADAAHSPLLCLEACPQWHLGPAGPLAVVGAIWFIFDTGLADGDEEIPLSAACVPAAAACRGDCRQCKR